MTLLTIRISSQISLWGGRNYSCYRSPFAARLSSSPSDDNLPRLQQQHCIVRCYSGWTVDSDTGIVSHRGDPRFQTIIGLELHAQLDISTKLFSGCPIATAKSKPNSAVWPIDAAIPGVLPRLSQEAVQAAVLSAAALNCHLPPVSRFERKHYFYADIPLGYQMTQQRWPLARQGMLQCRRENSKKKSVDDTFTTHIERIQLEQDTGKTTVMTNPTTQQKESLVDLNRAGRALIEIVFHPDLRSAVDAATAVETLRLLLKHIGTCDGKMEEGSLRCDLNLSIAAIDDDNKHSQLLEQSGSRVEVKNLNSLRQVQQAAEYEAIRQAEASDLGAPTEQETRTFDVASGETVVIRTKEGTKDYRFMPEPDLPPVVLNEDVFGEGCKTPDEFLDANLPELPGAARQRLQSDYKLSDYSAGVVVSDPPAIQLFDDAVQEAQAQVEDDRLKQKIPEAVVNLLVNELFALVREFETQRLMAEGFLDAAGTTSVKYSRINGHQLGEVVALLLEGTISNTMAKQLLRILYEQSDEDFASPRQVAQENGFQLITDPDRLGEICRIAIENHPQEMERYKMGGKFAKKITKLLMGKAMGASKGNAHPERLREVLLDVLDEVAPLSE